MRDSSNHNTFESDYRDAIVNLAHQEIFSPDGARGLEYLHNRGLTNQIIKDWNLGYCPKYADDYRLNDKILIPFYDSYENLLSVSLRKIEDDKPVWWNESFEKNNYLFGLNKAKKHIFDRNLAIVVEGQFDVISFHQHGLQQAVGLCGKGFSDRRLSLLTRYCNRIVLALDSDENQSGQDVAKKLFDFLKNKNLYIYIWFLPQGTDPDEFVRKFGKDACKKRINDVIKKFPYKDRKLGVKYFFGDC